MYAMVVELDANVLVINFSVLNGEINECYTGRCDDTMRKKHYYCFSKNNRFFAFDTLLFCVLELNKDQYNILNRINIHNDLDNNLENDDMFYFLKKCMEHKLLISEIPPKKVIKSKKAISLSFTPVHNCNLNCSYCFAKQGKNFKNKNKEITDDVVNGALRFVKKWIQKSNDTIRIDLVGGGENFLNTSGVKIIVENEIIQQDNIPVFICTNGTIYDDNVKKILMNKNVYLGISLDGDKENNDHNRLDKLGKSVYPVVMNNIKKIKEELIKYNSHLNDLWALVVITAKTDSLVKILKHHKKVGFSSIQMKLVRSKKRFTESEINHINILYDEMTEYFISKVNIGQIEEVKMILNDNDYFGKILKRLILNQHYLNRCKAGQNKFAFTVNGDIYPCDAFVGIKEFYLGNVFDLESGIIANNFTNLETEMRSPCKDCWAKDLCGSDCMSDCYMKTGDIFCVSDDFCAIQKNIIKNAIYLFYTISHHEELFLILNDFLRIRDFMI